MGWVCWRCWRDDSDNSRARPVSATGERNDSGARLSAHRAVSRAVLGKQAGARSIGAGNVLL